MRQSILLAASVLLAFGGGFGSPAHAQMIGRAAPLGAADPLRLKAQPLVELIFKGELAAAATSLKASAAPGSPAATDAKAQIDALAATFGGGGFVLDRMGKMGPADLLVYGNKVGGGRAAISIRFEPAAPHRVTEIVPVTIGNGSRR